MSLDVSGLSAYTDEHKLDLIKRSILKGRTIEMINVQPDIKNSATINILGSTLTAQAGACGWNEAGSTDLTQRTITVCPIKVNESICLDTLESYYTSKMMNPGSYNEDIPFEQIFSEEKADQIGALVEDLVWRGDTGGAGNLALCDGFIKLFEGLTSSVVDGSNGGTYTGEITSANAVEVVDYQVSVIPTDVIDADDLVLFMSYTSFRTYAQALRDANLFHYNGSENQGGEFQMMHPGTNVKVVAVRGLNGAGGDMVLSPASNLYLGTDLLNDSEDFKIFFSEDNDEVRFRSKWKQGVEVAFPEFVVHYDAA